MTIVYRDAGPPDLPAIDALYRAEFDATFGHRYRTADYEAFMAKFTLPAWADELARPDVAIRLAKSAGVLVGFVKISDPDRPDLDLAPMIEVQQLYVRDDAKGTGVADTLMDWVDAQGRARGAAGVILSVFDENHRAKRFYQRRGFVDIGRNVFMVGEQADDDRWYRKPL